jgi:hypothetical protein
LGGNLTGLTKAERINTCTSGHRSKEQIERFWSRRLAPGLYGLIRGNPKPADLDVHSFPAGKHNLQLLSHIGTSNVAHRVACAKSIPAFTIFPAERGADHVFAIE